MSYSEIYTRINWENEPDTSTPLDKDNLNHMDAALKAFDLLIKEIGNNSVVATDIANCLFGQPTINQSTGVITFPKKDGGSYTLDTLLEKVVVNFDWNPTTQKLTITLEDGTTKEVDLSALIQENEFDDTSTIDFTVSGHRVSAVVKEHSIGATQLEQNYLADCETAAESSEDSAEAAAESEENAEAWAVGQRNGTDVDSSDPTYHNNSKYYSEQSNALGQAQAQNAEAWSSGTRNGVPVSSSDPAYHNNAKYWRDQASAVVSNTFAGLDDVDLDNIQNGQVPTYNSTTQKWENAAVPTVDISGKADKVSGATNGNLAKLNTNGNLVDAGVAASALVTTSKTAAASGTDLSLVTTGEKADWNAKTSNTGTVTSVVAGTGLNGGTISTSGTLSVKYGTAAGTACQGNDSRLSDARSANGGISDNMRSLNSAGQSHGNSWLLTDKHNVNGDGCFYLYTGDDSVKTSVYKANVVPAAGVQAGQFPSWTVATPSDATTRQVRNIGALDWEPVAGVTPIATGDIYLVYE